MRRLFLILEACVLTLGVSMGQSTDSTTPQLPVGQVFKQFEFPGYENGKLKYTLFATEAKGITLNRAETTDLKIDIYDNGVVTTTVTSPKADLYVTDQKMRTKNTVRIDRDDMVLTSQICDFDMKTKKGVMRTNVKVVLKHFDLSQGASGTAASGTPAASKPAVDSTTPAAPMPTPDTVAPIAPTPVTDSTANVPPTPAPTVAPAPMRSSDSLLTSPGTYSDTNSAPLPPSSSQTK
jgi:hypothetical protein